MEQVNISGINELIKWSLTLPNLETFVYIGTATICGKEINNRVVKEEESPNPKVHHVVKYTYTKMMGEILLAQHLPKEKILIVRPSIIMGDSRDWIPRSYVILWAIETVNMLRLVPVNGESALDVIPVDFASKSITCAYYLHTANILYITFLQVKIHATNSGKVMKAIEPNLSLTCLPLSSLIRK